MTAVPVGEVSSLAAQEIPRAAAPGTAEPIL
jgi:hypothetical protein